MPRSNSICYYCEEEIFLDGDTWLHVEDYEKECSSVATPSNLELEPKARPRLRSV